MRNSGLLLLRSLVDFLFGTSDSKELIHEGWDGKTNRLSYTKFSALPGVLKSLLNSQGVAEDTVFPALDIVRRAGPPRPLRQDLFCLVSEYLGSPIWHVRDMAARTLCSFFLTGAFSVGNLCADARSSSNRAHGTLLAAKYLAVRCSKDRLADVGRRI